MAWHYTPVTELPGTIVNSNRMRFWRFRGELKFRLLSPSQHTPTLEDDCNSMPSASPQYNYPVSDYGYPGPQGDCFQENGFQSGYDPFTQLTAMAAEQNFTGNYSSNSQCPSPNYSMQNQVPSFPSAVTSSTQQYFPSGLSCRYSAMNGERRSCEMDTSDSCSRNNCKKSYPSHAEDLFEDQDSFLSWTRKHPEHWNCKEVLDWLFYLGQEKDLNMSQLRAEAFQDLNGTQLCSMTLDDFNRIDPKFGKLFYEMLKKLLLDGVVFTKPSDVSSPDMQDLPSFTPNSCDSAGPNFQPCNSPVYTNLVRKQDPDSYTDGCIKTERQEVLPCSLIDNMAPYFDFDPSDTPQLQPNAASEFYHPEYVYHAASYPNSTPVRNSYNFPGPHFPQQLPRRRPGRPRVKSIPDDGSRSHKDKKVKNQHLWEFIYEALLNPMYNPLYLRWENQREGVFRFVQSEAVAQLWGALKNNDNMTYEKLSRAMRHYYKRGILERVEGRRLVYKFSRKAIERVREKRNSI